MTGGQKNLLIVAVIVLVLIAGRNGVGPGAPSPAKTPTGPAVTGPLAVPVVGGRVTSGFGKRWGTGHYGTDVAAPTGTPIRAIAAGTVIEAGPASGFGLWVRLRHRDGTVSVYGHMHRITTKTGARVKAGQQIATVGSRGQSTGPHLHLEIWPGGQRSKRVDPLPWFARHGADLT